MKSRLMTMKQAPFIFDGDQYSAEVFLLLNKFPETGSIGVSSCGVAVGIVTNKPPVGVPKGYKVGPKSVTPMPVVEKNTYRVFLCQSIILPQVGTDFDRKTPTPEQFSRTPERGAGVAVDQWQLPFIIGNQLFDICFITQKPQGIVGGDPAAAGGSTGAKTIAPFFPGNPGLVVNQLFHISRLDVGG